MKTFADVLGWLAGIALGTVIFLLALPWLGLTAMPPPAVPEPPAPENSPAEKAQSRMSKATPPPKQTKVEASFQVVENVLASGSLTKAHREELDQFAFPPMNFQWAGGPEALAPAFLWEDGQGRLHYGDQMLADMNNDGVVAENYSSKLAIRFKGTPGRLRLHFNVISRLRDWVGEVSEGIKGAAPVDVRIEVPGFDRVILHVPAVGKVSARAFVVSLTPENEHELRHPGE